jgi:ketosteroid isomerase-like protein
VEQVVPDTIARLRASYAALNQGDITGTMEVLAEDATWVEHSELPEAGSYRGRETIRGFLEQFLESWDRFEQDIEDVQTGNGCVLLFIRLVARGKGSGIDVQSRYAHLWTMRDGVGVRVDAYYDREQALAALRAARGD